MWFVMAGDPICTPCLALDSDDDDYSTPQDKTIGEDDDKKESKPKDSHSHAAKEGDADHCQTCR